MPQGSWGRACTSVGLLGLCTSVTGLVWAAETRGPKSRSCQGWFSGGHPALLGAVFMLTWHLLQMPFLPHTDVPSSTHSHLNLFSKDSKEHHLLKCQRGAQYGQPFDIMTWCCHLESSHSRTRQLRLKKKMF